MPRRWVGPRSDCYVDIDVPLDGSEVASLTEIQAAARNVLMKCVLGDQHLGGVTVIGNREGLLVSVLGDG